MNMAYTGMIAAKSSNIAINLSAEEYSATDQNN